MSSFPLLTALSLLPLLAALFVRRQADPDRARNLALGAAGLTLGLSLLAAARFHVGVLGAQLPERFTLLPSVGLEWYLALDGLSVALVPMTCLIALASLVGCPHSMLPSRSAAAVLAQLGTTLLAVLCMDLLLLTVAWCAHLLPVGGVRRHEEGRWSQRTSMIFTLGCSVPMASGAALLAWYHRGAAGSSRFDLAALTSDLHHHPHLALPLALLSFSALMRMGVVPLHAWLPVLLEDGPPALGPMTLGTPKGVFLLVRLVLPLLPAAARDWLPWAATAGLLGAVYAALVALVQVGLRRKVACLAVSQACFNMVGLASLNVESLHGSLLQKMASGVALCCMSIQVLALRARVGTSLLNELGGLARRVPRLTVGFLLAAVAAVGFPGTMTFVSEDLLLHGVIDVHPSVATLMLAVTVLNGITVLLAFHKGFLGRPSPRSRVPATQPIDDLLPRERWVAFGLFALVLLGGLFPQPFLRLHDGTVAALTEGDSHRSLRERRTESAPPHEEP